MPVEMAPLANIVRTVREVLGSDGEEVGTVDCVKGENLKLTKSDEQAGGEHHFLPIDKVESVNGRTVTLCCTADEAMSEWTGESDVDEDSASDADGIEAETASDDDEIDRSGQSRAPGSPPRKGGRIGEEPSSNVR